MSTKSDARLTPSQRMTRGLRYTAVGPVDLTWGALGVGLNGAQSSAAWVGDRYRQSRLKDQLAKDLAALRVPPARSAAAIKKARARRRRRPLLLAAIGVVALAGGAVAFSIIRRSTQPEPSPLAPSVEVTPKP
jgi:hypothetical protein